MRHCVPVLGVLFAAATLVGMSPGAVSVGDAAPEIKAKKWLNGKETTLAKQKGKVVLLEFWATW